MRWQRDLEGVPKILVAGKWVPEPIDKHWENRCGSCKFATYRLSGSVACSVTGRTSVPCEECEVP